MFDGTDLSVAYGSYNGDVGLGGGMGGGQLHSQSQQHQAPPHDAPIPKSTASHSMPPDPVYAPPPAMYAQQSSHAKPSGYLPPSDGFWDRVALKKWEVFKFFLMSLIVVLALSIDNVATHYMTSYIGKSFLTETQELLIRLSYPVGIILIIWLLKASF